MALHATVSCPTGNGVVLKGKRSRLLCMASHTHVLDDFYPLVAGFAGMDVVTIAAHHPPFGDGMVEVKPKLVEFSLMASATQ